MSEHDVTVASHWLEFSHQMVYRWECSCEAAGGWRHDEAEAAEFGADHALPADEPDAYDEWAERMAPYDES